jgi:DNA-binding transcriptional LysR family regulator
MDLRHLRSFIAVAEELHFGRAAARLHMAQPPLSQQIRALEDDIGARLFARTSRSVRLTPAGAALLAAARALLEQAQAAARTARRIHEGEAGELSVGYMNPVLDAVLCRALAQFRERRPEVHLRLRELPTPVQLEELRARRIDIAFVRLVEGAQDFSGLEHTVLLREPYLLALPQGHPLAALRTVPLAQAGAQPLILFPRAGMPALHDAVLAALRAAGAQPRVSQEVAGKHAAMTLVAAGFGVCLVPASARQWRRAGVALRRVSPGLPLVALAAVWREDDCPASGRLLADLASQAC